MPSAGDGVAWDVTIPTDSGEVADTGLEMREIKLATEIRLNKEHVDFDDASVGGEHEKGSAKAYYMSSYPTVRPDGTTTLNADDSGRILVRSDGPWLEVWDGAAFQKVRPADATVTAALVATGFLSDIYSYAVYSNRLGATDVNETAGTFTSGGWRTRVLNTEVHDAEAIGSLASNQITLPAGTYRVRAKAPALQVDYHQIRFRNETDGVTIGIGTMQLSGASDQAQSYSEVVAEWTLGHTAVYELQHRCSTTKAVVGFGAGAGSFGVAWDTAVVEIFKLK